MTRRTAIAALIVATLVMPIGISSAASAAPARRLTMHLVEAVLSNACSDTGTRCQEQRIGSGTSNLLGEVTDTVVASLRLGSGPCFSETEVRTVRSQDGSLTILATVQGCWAGDYAPLSGRWTIANGTGQYEMAKGGGVLDGFIFEGFARNRIVDLSGQLVPCLDCG